MRTAVGGGEEDDSWRYHGRFRQAAQNALYHLRRGLERIERFAQKTAKKILKEGLIAVGATAAVGMVFAVLGAPITVPVLVMYGAGVYTVTRFFILNKKLHGAFDRLVKRMETRVNKEADKINEEKKQRGNGQNRT